MTEKIKKSADQHRQARQAITTAQKLRRQLRDSNQELAEQKENNFHSTNELSQQNEEAV